MGLGTDRELLTMVALGIDMFDCVAPDPAGAHRRGDDAARAAWRCAAPPTATTCARSSTAAPAPPAAASRAPTCATSSAAGEILGHRLLSIHNITHVTALMAAARDAIAAGRFEAFRADTEARLRGGSDDEDGDGELTAPCAARRIGRRAGAARIPGTLGRRG